MPSIHIETPTTTDRTLRTTVQPSRDLARFFTGDPLEITYDTSIEDVPESILVIPALAQVCPVAWANGADVTADAVDATFVAAVEEIKATMLEMYDFLEGGELYAREVVDNDFANERSLESADAPPSPTSAESARPVETDGIGLDERNPSSGGESGLLFTGGVDSTCSYVRHREEAPTLISIRGWTISPDSSGDEQWNHLTRRVTDFADERSLETAFVEANMLSFLDHPMLLAHYKRYVDGGWYSSVGHGLGLLGLCAPMAAARGIDDLYMAATHWEGIDLEWGSRPDIDDHVRWGGTQCHHDCYDLTRQERLDAIAAYVDSDAPGLELQTCNNRMDGNCGTCEKCYRTAVGLRLSGLEPSDHGYPFSEDEYPEIRRALEEGHWILGEDERYMWEDIRDRSRETEPESPAERAFFEWLDQADLSSIVDNSGSPLHHRVLRAGARNAPDAVYSRLYPAWTVAKSGYQRLRPQ
ncbi:hypothetical protein [Natronosalvus vescus]|uniref:hypothetical protein n=1 Tax=Natronosalvus vescus TaxID=2953881 RepID=UPI002090616F|nr:hypothetical protein [Natronosalvus vescus]